MIQIDGSYGEGGGPIVRTACGLAVLTHSPVRIFNIRLRRPAPGLRPQHLLGVTALAELSGGRLEGAYVSSTELLLHPGRVNTGELQLKLATAGSIPLILQTLIPRRSIGRIQSRLVSMAVPRTHPSRHHSPTSATSFLLHENRPEAPRLITRGGA